MVVWLFSETLGGLFGDRLGCPAFDTLTGCSFELEGLFPLNVDDFCFPSTLYTFLLR